MYFFHSICDTRIGRFIQESAGLYKNRQIYIRIGRSIQESAGLYKNWQDYTKIGNDVLKRSKIRFFFIRPVTDLGAEMVRVIPIDLSEEKREERAANYLKLAGILYRFSSSTLY